MFWPGRYGSGLRRWWRVGEVDSVISTLRYDVNVSFDISIRKGFTKKVSDIANLLAFIPISIPKLLVKNPAK